MDLTFATAIELNVSRNILDTGARLFLFEHAPEYSAGYVAIDGGLVDGEVYQNWFIQRNRFGQLVLEVAYDEQLTPERVKNIDTIGYTGLHTNGDFGIFDVAEADYARSASDRTASLRLAKTHIGDTVVTTLFADIASSASGDNEVVAAVPGKKIRVLAYTIIASGDVDVKWRSAATDLTGVMPFTINSGVAHGYAPVGYFETASGEALNLNLSDAVAVGGYLVYVEV